MIRLQVSWIQPRILFRSGDLKLLVTSSIFGFVMECSSVGVVQ